MKKVFLTIALLAVLGFFASSVYQNFYKNGKSFNEANTIIRVDGPKEAEIGDEAVFSIYYKNGNRVNLKDAVITLKYPENGFSDIKDISGFGTIKKQSIVWEIGEIAGGFEGTIKFSAKIIGLNANLLTAAMDYQSENFNSDFSAKNEYTFSIKSPKISLDLFAPKELVSGQEIKYVLAYTNSTPVNFDGVRIKFNYPAGFVFSGSNPKSGDANDIWEIQNLTKSSSGQIEINGVLGGGSAEVKITGVVIEQKDSEGNFVFNNEISAQTNIISSPFSVTQTINGKEIYAASADEILNYTVRFRNLAQTPQNNLIVSVVLKGDSADFSTLAAENAAVDKSARTIIWDKKSKSELSSLAPDKEAEVNFSLKLKNQLPVSDSAGTGFLIEDTVILKDGNIFNADGANKTIISSAFEAKVNSFAALFTRGYFNDDGRLAAAGPIPPKVGETTTYNIHWQILNTNNKIKNVKVAGVLPENVRWAGNIFPLEEKIFYDINSRTITWEAGALEPGVGTLSPLREVLFQVSVNPTVQDIGKYLVLVDKNVLTATDDFTLSEISASSEGITTRLPDDLSIGAEQGKVAQ